MGFIPPQMGFIPQVAQLCKLYHLEQDSVIRSFLTEIQLCTVLSLTSHGNLTVYSLLNCTVIELILSGSVGEGTLFQVLISSKLDSHGVCTECLLLLITFKHVIFHVNVVSSFKGEFPKSGN